MPTSKFVSFRNICFFFCWIRKKLFDEGKSHSLVHFLFFLRRYMNELLVCDPDLTSLFQQKICIHRYNFSPLVPFSRPDDIKDRKKQLKMVFHLFKQRRRAHKKAKKKKDYKSSSWHRKNVSSPVFCHKTVTLCIVSFISYSVHIQYCFRRCFTMRAIVMFLSLCSPLAFF